MHGHRRSSWRILARFALGALAGAAATLAGSYAVASEIGGSFLLGASFTLLVGAVLLVSFSMHVRGVEGDAGAARSKESVDGSSLLAHFLIRPALSADLQRYSDHRLDGTLTVRNGSRNETRIVRIDVTGPPGSRIAVGDNAGAAVPTTVRFVSDRADADLPIPAKEKRALRFHVLLGEGGLGTRRVRLRVEFAESAESGSPPRVTRRAVSATVAH